MSETKVTTWTTRLLLEWMAEQFTTRNIDNPRLIGEMLLTHVLGGARIDLYADANRIASDAEREALRVLVQRAMKLEPVQYIVGNAWFFGLEFKVNNSTLIPRSCTERLVEQTIDYCNKLPIQRITIAEIGTGTGCIAVTLASNLHDAEIFASDISRDAIELARANAEIHRVESQISFLEGDGVSPFLTLSEFDVLCSNPPYIPDAEMEQLEPIVLDWEPKVALSGGRDGMDIVSSILSGAPKILKPNGLLIIEIASSTRDLALDLALSNPDLTEVKITRDAFGDERFLKAIRRV